MISYRRCDDFKDDYEFKCMKCNTWYPNFGYTMGLGAEMEDSTLIEYIVEGGHIWACDFCIMKLCYDNKLACPNPNPK